MFEYRFVVDPLARLRVCIGNLGVYVPVVYSEELSHDIYEKSLF
jgi:hypothetical protein